MSAKNIAREQIENFYLFKLRAVDILESEDLVSSKQDSRSSSVFCSCLILKKHFSSNKNARVKILLHTMQILSKFLK